ILSSKVAGDVLVAIVDLAPEPEEENATNRYRRLNIAGGILGSAAAAALIAKAIHEDDGGRLLPILAVIIWLGVLSAELRTLMGPLVQELAAEEREQDTGAPKHPDPPQIPRPRKPSPLSRTTTDA